MEKPVTEEGYTQANSRGSLCEGDLITATVECQQTHVGAEPTLQMWVCLPTTVHSTASITIPRFIEYLKGNIKDGLRRLQLVPPTLLY